MSDDFIYFDCSATTQPYPEVLDTFLKVSRDDFANPSSNHALGYQASAMLEKARAQSAKYLGCLPEEVIFTSGATEGNNLAIKGVAYHQKSWAKRLITTKAEHPSVLSVFKELETEGFEVIYLDYDKDGKLDFQELEAALNEETSLVSIMAVNNETGYVFDIAKASSLIHRKSRAYLHVDATQAIGKMILPKASYDLLTFSGHKIGGLKGSGILVKKKAVLLDPQILGGGQEKGYRSGTSMLGLDCSLATALRISTETLPQRLKQAQQVNQALREGLSPIKEVVITSPKEASPFILNFALTQHKGSVVAEALSNAHIYVSTTSACSSREVGKSYVLEAAGYDDVISANSIRLSFSGNETLEQVQVFLKTLTGILQALKAKE
jgi:cysteine desulfurase